MALDGRRRRLALILLRDAGKIDDDYLVDCKLAVSPAQQAAAIVLPNTEHAPVHIADVIVAIGKLRKAKMDTRAIAAALGYAELEIKAPRGPVRGPCQGAHRPSQRPVDLEAGPPVRPACPTRRSRPRSPNRRSTGISRTTSCAR